MQDSPGRPWQELRQAPALLAQQVLRTDVAGMPLEWIDYREAARLYHTQRWPMPAARRCSASVVG